MSTERHVHAQLSAYIDGALDQAERAAVRAHLDGCTECRARMTELQATAGLIRSLPGLVPGRRLVPHVAAPPAWLAPLRTLSTIASGVSMFLFIASALLANIGQLASSAGTTALNAPVPAAAPAAGGVGAPAASRNETAAPNERTTADSAAKQATSPTPPGAQFSVSSTQPPTDAVTAESIDRGRIVASRDAGRALGPSPWLWLALAVFTGAIAIAVQRRLRSA